ncbi:MAG: DUF4129 domain-containing protein, partial [Cyanobacteria bacterium P01_H01_bin.130]
GAISLVVLGAILWFLWKFWRGWRYQQRLKRLPPMESLYRQFINALARDYPKRPWQTPLEYVQAYESWAANESQGAPGRSQRVALLRQISQAYVNWRYGPNTPQNTPDLEQLQQQWQQLRRSRFGR